MQIAELKLKLFKWLENFVEVPNKSLNNWSPCPYARQARLENKIYIDMIENHENIKNIILKSIDKLEKYDVIVFCLDHKSINYKILESTVLELNNELKQKDTVLLEDHPDMPEFINGVKMNFDHCALILVQKLSKLKSASNQLKGKGYYDVWSEENLNFVVNWRNK